MKRIFAAVKIEPDAKFLKSFRDLRARLNLESIKWVEEYNIHVTLKFFGETDEMLIPRISETLEKISQGSPVLNFRLSGIGIFGSQYQPRVVWAVIDPPEPLARLMKETQLECEKLGYIPDRLNLIPHLTLGRIKYLKDKFLFQKVIKEYKGINSEPVLINEFILYESKLRKEGPEYFILDKFVFGESPV